MTSVIETQAEDQIDNDFINQFLGDDGFQLTEYFERDLASSISDPPSIPYDFLAENGKNPSAITGILDPLLKATALLPESENLNSWLAAEQSIARQQPYNTLITDWNAALNESIGQPNISMKDPVFVPNIKEEPLYNPSKSNPTPYNFSSSLNPAFDSGLEGDRSSSPLLDDLNRLNATFGSQPLTQNNNSKSSAAHAPRSRAHSKPLPPAHDEPEHLEDDDNEEHGGEKSLKRKLQTRAASKLYRQRKKALELQLTERLAKLEEEKKLLLQEHNKAELLLKTLREENSKLKSQQLNSSKEISKARLELLKKLAQQINENADEQTLRDTISEIGKCCMKCIQIGSCSLKQLISPNSVEQLVHQGFFEDKAKIEILSRKRGLDTLRDQIRTEIKSLTPDQLEQIDRIVIENSGKLEIDYKEREELVKQIVVVFREYKSRRSDVNQLLESVRCLEHLRKSLETEAQHWTEGFHQMVSVMTPIQTAQFLLRVEFQYATVCQLNTFWTALSQSWANEEFQNPLPLVL